MKNVFNEYMTHEQQGKWDLLRGGVQYNELIPLPCKHKDTGEEVIALCLWTDTGRGKTLVPLATMIDGNPFLYVPDFPDNLPKPGENVVPFPKQQGRDHETN